METVFLITKTVFLIIGGMIVCVFFVFPLLEAIVNQFVNIRDAKKKLKEIIKGCKRK